MNIWASMFCMGNPDKKKPDDIVKLYFDDELDDEFDGEHKNSLPTPDECKGMLEEINAINDHFKEKAEE
jgi:hypothetical protein